MSAQPPAQRWDALPLFPLGTVLYPGGFLKLKVFEARYVDLMGHCLRSGEPFAVVALRAGSEVRSADAAAPQWHEVATLATLRTLDAEQPGILMVSCEGGPRVRLGPAREGALGLWRAPAQAMQEAVSVPPPPSLATAAAALGQAFAALAARGLHPVPEPHRLDDAGWVAHRWCELLPLPLHLRQQLLEVDDPVLRLTLVDGFLRQSGILGGRTASAPAAPPIKPN